MEFTRTRLQTEEVRTVEITELVADDVRPWQYTSSGKTWQPTAIRITFTSDRHDGGTWSPWKISRSIKVLGHNVKADGSQGADRDEDHWSLRESPYTPRAREILDELNASEGMPASYWVHAVVLP